ncbi:MAG: glycosyltransferase family 2 protein [Methanococcaceae archaeon]
MTILRLKKPVFSIITPTFRRPEMLVRNIKSVLSQTFGDYEHIIVDDGNDPATDKIVESFIDERLILMKHDQPRGAAAAYNSGIKKSRGEFITFLDDDDEYLPEYLQKINQYFHTSSEIHFIWTGIEKVIDRENGSEYVTKKIIWPSVFDDLEIGIASATSIGNGFGVCLRRNCPDEVGYYDEGLQVGEDTDFLFRLVSRYKFMTIPEVLVRIHAHERNQLTGKQNFALRIMGKETILKRHEDILEKYQKVFMVHYHGYACLCYESGMKLKARKAIRSIIGKNPFRLITYIDFLALEITGYAFGLTKLGLMLKKISVKSNQN